MVMPGLINLDFADVRSVMHEMGKAMMGTGEAEGDGRALEAAEKAIANPLLDGVSMQGAKGVIVSITGGEDMRLMEVDEAANHIRELVDPDANIIWGSAFNENLQGKIRVSVVATGIDSDAMMVAAARPNYAMNSGGYGNTVASAPVKPLEAPVPVAAPAAVYADSEEPLPLTAEAEVPDVPTTEPIADGPSFASLSGSMIDNRGHSAAEDDELVLGSEAEHVATYQDEEPEPAPQAEPVAPRVTSGGGTLFERMSNLRRSANQEDEADDVPRSAREPLDIPRFLNRQNNQ
jgi:cell division protein FtsZ